MTRAVIVAAMLMVAGCERKAAPVADDTAIATAAAERKAVADTDAAQREAVSDASGAIVPPAVDPLTSGAIGSAKAGSTVTDGPVTGIKP